MNTPQLFHYILQLPDIHQEYEDLKGKLRESGVIQYLNVIKNLAVENFKESFKKLRLDEQRKNKLLIQLLRGI